MIPAEKRLWAARVALGGLAILCVVLILLFPQHAAAGVQDGLALCYNSLIPALFPFLILTRILIDTGASGLLGLPLLPYCRLLGIRDKRAASAAAIGLLGGFAASGSAVDLLVRRGRITPGQAEVLLCGCAVEGPAFLIFAVGGGMLGSLRLGVLLWISVVLSSLLCALPFARRRSKIPTSSTAEMDTAPTSCALLLVGAVSGAVDAMLRICGFVLFFSLLRGILLSFALPQLLGATLLSLLEVTTGCRSACAVGGEPALALCLVALGTLGLCGLAQLRALLSPGISLSPFLRSRLLQLPLSMVFFFLLRRWFASGVTGAFSPQSQPLLVLPLRMPREAALFLFLFLAVFCSELAGKKSLRRRSKGI
ncbi:MAG TPA: hypothetical protein H9896_02325 [Candidatus Pygmaiobacter gallistercoris]|nr:hypothetical protein [Candidatus Pygmaiobacter gallistercoris]